MTNLSKSQKGGYRNLLVYQLAKIIYALNIHFIKKHIGSRRTQDQMEQAGRSGKQCIVEASLEKSLKMNIKLNGVSRGSFGELLEDYEDFLSNNNLKLWDKNDPRVLKIRRIRISSDRTNWSNKSNSANLTNWSNWTNSKESFANLMVTLLHLENYLLDQLTRKLEQKFITEGGYSENLTRRRLERKRKLD